MEPLIEPSGAAPEEEHDESKWYQKGLWQSPRLMRGDDHDTAEYEIEREMSATELFYGELVRPPVSPRFL